MPVTEERVTSNRFHFAIPVVSIAESKNSTSISWAARLAMQKKVNGKILTSGTMSLPCTWLNVLPRESHDVDMGRVCVPFWRSFIEEDFDALKAKIEAARV